MKITIRKANISDIVPIHELINNYAKKNVMLPRALNDLYDALQSYVVAVAHQKVIGCCCLNVTWDDLAEIRSLAVDPRWVGKGIGKRLMSFVEKEAIKLGIHTIFALTFKPTFFKHLGFKEITRDKLPHKVWGDCIRCHLFPDCGEIPLIKTIEQ